MFLFIFKARKNKIFICDIIWGINVISNKLSYQRKFQETECFRRSGRGGQWLN